MTMHLVSLFFLVACSEKHEHEHEHGHDDTAGHGQHHTSDDTGIGPMNHTREAITDGGTWTVRYVPDPDPIPLSDNFTVSVTVEKDGVADPDALLNFDSDMPTHGHGMNTEATVGDNQDGTFHIEGMSFHMPGHWRLHAWVSGEGQAEEWAWFDVECCD